VFSSIEGVDSAFDITPGLIVVSSQLSDLGGVEMLKSIYDGGAYEGLKIIGITSSTMNHDDLVTFENYCDRVCSLPLLVTDVHSHLLALYDNDTLDKPGSAIAADTLVVHQFPPHPTLEELKMLALCGNYVEISKIICTLERENIGYSGFCSEMRKRIKKYDSDGIAMFLATAVPC
jgi:hypothetical protein